MKLRLLTMGLMLLAAGIHAQEHAGHEMPMTGAVAGSVATSGSAVESESTRAFRAVDAKMHKAMAAVVPTGDADVDFLRGMVPHHQGAVDMANVVLKYGTDAEVRMLAGDIIKAQEKEIRWMQDWLAKHGPKDASASDARVEALPVMPVAVAAAAVASPTLPASGTVPAAEVSGTTAQLPGAEVAIVTGDGMNIPAELMPAMPAPNEAIENKAPAMELIRN